MANGKLRRTLLLKVTLPSADPSHILTMVKMSAPFYGLLGGTSIRLLQNADDPARYIQEIEYETHEAWETSRQRIASDVRVQAFLQTWRNMIGGAVELEVYEELTPPG